MSLPTKTIAAVLVEQKKPLEICEINLPQNLEIGQVLVEISYSGICGSQIGEIQGVKGHDPWLPHLLGHEGSGKVLAIGPGVRHVKPNDYVVLHWRKSQGIESVAPKYLWNGKTVNAGWVTTFNRHAIVSENRLTTIDASADLKTAALYGCAITTGFGLIDNVAKLKIGHNVVVFGSGGIGLNIIQAAHLSGANRIIGIDQYDHRLLLAKACGATHTINSSNENPWAVIKEIIGTQVDIFIDNTGNPDIIAKGYEICNESGQVLLVGVPKKGGETSLYTLPLHFGKKITGTHGGEANPHTDIPRYMSIIQERGIDLSLLISESQPLNKINSMLDNMVSGKSSGRCIIDLTK